MFMVNIILAFPDWNLLLLIEHKMIIIALLGTPWTTVCDQAIYYIVK